jgi:hypothetical protein
MVSGSIWVLFAARLHSLICNGLSVWDHWSDGLAHIGFALTAHAAAGQLDSQPSYNRFKGTDLGYHEIATGQAETCC